MTSGDRATVVVSSSEAATGEVLARIIESAGHEAARVPEVGSVVGAVAGAAALVLDHGAANLATLQAVRAASPLRVVVVGTGPASALVAWQSGADVVLSRPFAAADLQTSLDAALSLDDDGRAARRTSEIALLSA